MGSETSTNDKDILSKLLSSLGLSYEVPESQINAYCGLFASGIGFVSFLYRSFYCIHCLHFAHNNVFANLTKNYFSDVPNP